MEERSPKEGEVIPDLRKSLTLSTVLKSFHSGSDYIRKSSAAILRENLSPSLLHKNFDAILPADLPTSIELFYYTGWDSVFLHFDSGGEGKWTVPPGMLMTRVNPVEFNLPLFDDPTEAVWHFSIPDCSSAQFVPNMEGKFWDKPPSNGNYWITSPGRYMLRHGILDELLEPPDKPALIRVDKVTSSEITIAWNPPVLMASLVTHYKVIRNSKVIATVGTEDMSYTDKGLMGLQSYHYVVVGVNRLGQEGRSSDSCEAKTAEPGMPSAPMHVFCAGHSPQSITIAWSEPLDHGGAPVKYYRVYRNGQPLSVVPAQTAVAQRLTDDTVEAGVKYEFHVRAMHHRPIDALKASASQLAINRMGSSVTATVRAADEGPASDTVTAQAVLMLEMPRIADGKTHIILQTFNWQSCFSRPGWYKILQKAIERMTDSEITMAWLPPPCESVSAQGYMPTRWYNLSSCYGTETELRSLIDLMRQSSIAPMLDLVVNHRCGTKQDAKGHWTIFEDPAWENWAIVSNNLQGYEGGGVVDTGEQSECAPDIDHTNPRIQKDVKAWTTHLFEIGFASVRIDMAPGYNVITQTEYVRNLGTPFAVGEYWSGDLRVLDNYVKAGANLLAAFDFALYYILRHAVESSNYSQLNSNGRVPGLAGSNSHRAVTFLDNHDTVHLDFVGKFAGGRPDAILRGYAYLLTHPGTPSIYWDHWADYGEDIYVAMKTLCKIRKKAKLHSGSGVYIDRAEDELYAAYISTGPQTHRGGGQIAMKLGRTDWMPHGDWKVACFGEQFCVWER